MTRASDVLKDYSDAGPFHSLVPVQTAIDDHTFLTKSGDLLQVLKLGGVDYECLDASDVAQIVQRW